MRRLIFLSLLFSLLIEIINRPGKSEGYTDDAWNKCCYERDTKKCNIDGNDDDETPWIQPCFIRSRYIREFLPQDVNGPKCHDIENGAGGRKEINDRFI